MDKIKFYKYQGTGNDFIMIDNRSLSFDKDDRERIAKLCDRRFGIGADGLILLENDVDSDFRMVYFNSDGSESTMCGNGGRCIVMFGKDLEVYEGEECSFIAVDGVHEASINDGLVKLKMMDVSNISRRGDDYVLDTGSPHFVQEVNNLAAIDIHAEGKKIRHSAPFREEGINVNFVQSLHKSIQVATYERGVEAETYSCGTGVTAAALAMHEFDSDIYRSPQNILTKGGKLRVHYTKDGEKYISIFLEGPAIRVFEGEWSK